MELSTILIIASLLVLLYLFLKRLSNARRPVKEEEFDQAGVKVSFCNGTIAIEQSIYDVNQVSGIHLKTLESERHKFYDNETKKVIIEIDDVRKPSYKVNFLTRAQAERFILRLVGALRAAGSPKSI